LNKKSHPFKILIVSDVSISKVVGGAERVLHEQATRLVQKRHDVHILTRKLQNQLLSCEKIQGVNEWRYEFGFENSLACLISNFNNAKKLFEQIQKKYNFDYINFHQPFTAFGVIQSSLSKKIKKIYTCHSLSFEEFISRNHEKTTLRTRLFNIPNIFIRKQIEKKVLEKSDRIAVLSKFTKDKLVKTYRTPHDKISVIHGGVNLIRFHPFKARTLLRTKLKIPENKTVLLTVRNLVNRMGLKNLILSIKKIINNAPDIHLVIGGDGPLKTELIAFRNRLGLEDKIHFSGFISEDQLPVFYQMADIFVLPTRELEGFGLVTLEAMASGLPVLGTPVGGTKEIIGKFDSSFLFKGNDPDSMAELIMEKCQLVRNNPQAWKEISHRCRNFVERNYSWEKNIDSLEELIAKTLSN
jgi:glycosyltransferase involved in cell wall biosynthesis